MLLAVARVVVGAFGMSRFKAAFSNRHVVLAVVHAEDLAQASNNADIACEAGFDGAFLINHSIPHMELLAIHQALQSRLAPWWLGVNCLDLTPEEVFRVVPREVAGLWVDNAGIDERSRSQPHADAIDLARKRSGWQGLYFGGVAFKYQREVEDLRSAAAIARQYMDIVTTSGPGTGQAASHGKIVALREALGEFPLAIASGITPENVGDYLDVADCFLVATGISRSFTQIDPARARALIRLVRQHPSGQ